MEDKIVIQRESAGRRAAAYWFIDGLPEIFFGVLYIALGSIGLVWGSHLKNPWITGAMAVVFLAFVLTFCKDRAILDYFKARVTYPRTGYVSPPAEPAPALSDKLITLGTAPPFEWNVTSFRMRTAFFFFLMSRLVNFTTEILSVDGRWSVAIVMALVALGVYAGNRRDAHAYSWQSALAIAMAGLLSAAVEVPPRSRQFLPLLIGGVWFLAHGVPTLVHYLRTFPAPKGAGA